MLVVRSSALASRRPAVWLSAASALVFAPGAARANGMPQLDFKDPFLLGQVAWGAVIFAVFYVILSRSALPRVAKVLTNRAQRIQSDLEVARRARGDADNAVDALRRARAEAAAQAQANIDEVVQAARKSAEEQARAMNARLEADIAHAEEEIAQAHREAMARLPEIATDTARALAAKLLTPAGALAVNDDALVSAVRAKIAASA